MKRFRRLSRRICLGLTLTMVLAQTGFAGIIQVPGDHPTIQGAIDAAVAGDQILVQPGVYQEAVDFKGKNIQVIGIDGSASTVIDASGLNQSVVSCKSGEPATALLQGFTVTGGLLPAGAGGAGIFLKNASPTIRSCRIEGNATTTSSGGGIRAEDSFSTISNCWIRNNVSGNNGGGVFSIDLFVANSGVVVQDCTITGNSAKLGASLGEGEGGGVFGVKALLRCYVADNQGTYGGGASTILECEDSVFVGNSATQFGGGYFQIGEIQGAPHSIRNATFLNNSAGQRGGAVYLLDIDVFASILVSNVIAANNTAGSAGSGFFLNAIDDLTSTIQVSSCTLFGNNIQNGGGNMNVRNTIVWGVANPIAGAATVSYSDIQGGYPGTNNLNADPSFADVANDDYHLLSQSPCKNAGINDPAVLADIDGDPRVLDGVQDIGADEFFTWKDLHHALAAMNGLPDLSLTGSLAPNSSLEFLYTQGKPNSLFGLISSSTAIYAPFKGGVLVPDSTSLLFFTTDAAGRWLLTSTWPPGFPSNFTVYFQVWQQDPGGIQGWSASNAVAGTTP